MAKTALDNIDFKLFLTTTLNRGHIEGIDQGDVLILPVAARDEEEQSTTQESMFNYIRLSDGGIERLSNVRSEISILADIGKQLLPDSQVDFSQLKNHDTLRETIANTIPGLEKLKDIGVA
ncbi:MAG: anaerobic selenocysteine-containing dehydrogenase [Cellvibrionaceae bacterium]